MGSKSVTKAVAKKLKYYVDIKRREDAFDLSGPYLPPQEPMPQRAGPTLAYDGIHDRSLKHYFRDPEVKKQVGKMTIPSQKSYREHEVRRVLDVEMSKRDYKLNPEPESPYLSAMRNRPARHRPQALISVDEYLNTKKGSRQRKLKPDMIGKPRKALRRSPPQFVNKNEHERLVNMAARLIAATETAALPGNRYSQSLGETSTCESSLPDVQSFTEESSDAEMNSRRNPRPPSRAGGPRTRWTPPRLSHPVQNGENKRKALSKSSNNSDTSENSRQVSQRKTPKKKDVISPYHMRPTTAGKPVRRKPLEPSLQPTPYRAQSARINGIQNGEYYDSGRNGSRESGRKNGRGKNKQMVNSFLASSDDERNVVNDEKKLFYKRSLKSNIPQSRTLTYEVHLLTGDCRGAGTEADIKLTIFGEYGTSGERPLLKSMNHPRKFRRGQVDIFPIDSLYLGELQNIRIGHSQTSSENGWYLDKVFISEGKTENRVYEFPCKRWFSSQKDDGQILRDLSVSELISESELNNKLDEYTSHAQGSSDDDSGDSYTSESSEDSAKEDKKRDDDRTTKFKTKENHKASRQDKKERQSKNSRTSKKSVSFEGDEERDEQVSDNPEEKTRRSEDGYSSRSEKSDYSSDNSHSEDENTDVKRGDDIPEGANSGYKSPRDNTESEKPKDTNSESKSSKFQNSKGKSSGGKRSEGKSSEAKNSQDNTSEVKSSQNKSSEGQSSEGKKEEDDFWSASTDKPEQIHYDLGVEDEASPEKDDSSSRSSSSASSRHAQEEDEKQSSGDEGNESERNESGVQAKEGSADAQGGLEVKSDDDAKDYMAGFLAGVRATEHEKELQKEHEGSDDDDGGHSNDSDEDEHFILGKGPSLHFAVSTGNAERAKELIQHNPSLKDQTDEKGWIPLHVSCAAGQLECAKLLAATGGNLEQETPTGYTSMHLAAMNGHVNCMMVLFALGAEISCRTIDEYTPLHLAAMSGHAECVKWLLANRAKHDVTDVNGRTPSDIAEEYCYEDVAKLLKSFKKELTRSDSTLAHLMTYEGKRRKSTESITSETAGTPSKVADSGVGGLESGEENWVSDNEDDEDDDEVEATKSSAVSGQRPSSGSQPASGRRPGSARGRPGSARSDDSVGSISRTDSMTSMKEKQKLYEKQRQQMKKRNSSFLDSIRMDVEGDFNTNF